jgi:hypothetical protein
LRDHYHAGGGASGYINLHGCVRVRYGEGQALPHRSEHLVERLSTFLCPHSLPFGR